MRNTDFNIQRNCWTQQSAIHKSVTYRGAKLEAYVNTESDEYHFYLNDDLLVEDHISDAPQCCDLLFILFESLIDLVADYPWTEASSFGEWTYSDDDPEDTYSYGIAHGLRTELRSLCNGDKFIAQVSIGPVAIGKEFDDKEESIAEAERMADVIISFMEEVHDNGFLVANWNVFESFSKKEHKQFLRGILDEMETEEPAIYETLMKLGDEKKAIKHLWACTDLLLLNMTDTPYCDCIDFLEDLMDYLVVTLREREAEYDEEE